MSRISQLFYVGLIVVGSLARLQTYADEAAEAKIFFLEFPSKSVKGSERETVATLENLIMRVSASPWGEILLLKKCQLVEVYDGESARAGYRKVLEQAGRGTTPESLSKAIKDGARQGLRRLLLVDLNLALNSYYKKHVEYPESLQALVAEKWIAAEKIRDESGKPFDYQASADPLVPKLTRQRHNLELGARKLFTLDEVTIAGSGGTGETMSALLRSPRESKQVKRGDSFFGHTVALVRDEGVILCDSDNVIVIKVK